MSLISALAPSLRDTGFVERVVLDQLSEGGMKDFLLDERVDFELDANLVRQRLLAVCGFGTLELLEQILDLAIVALQQGDRIGELRLGHPDSPTGSWPMKLSAPTRVPR